MFSVANDGDTVPSWNALKRRNVRLRHNSLCRGAPTTTAMRHKLQLAPPYLWESTTLRRVMLLACTMRSAFLATLASLRKLVDHNVRLGESSNEARTVKMKYTGGGSDICLECCFLIPQRSSSWNFFSYLIAHQECTRSDTFLGRSSFFKYLPWIL